ncbi:MAG: ArsB/NhaD family transporter [Deltaproteobacteria bacterium]|nr:ArsB/NhaD family transporter [Deltaproteobacteria bacterium]
MFLIREKIKIRKILIGFSIIFLLFSICCDLCYSANHPRSSHPADILIVSGMVTDTHGKGVKGVNLKIFFNGRKVEGQKEVITSRNGTYESKTFFPHNSLSQGIVEIEPSKPAYARQGRIKVINVVEEKRDALGNEYYLAHLDFVLERVLSPGFWIATATLLVVYALIAFEIVHRTLAAFLGASLMLAVSYTAGTFYPSFRILTFDDAARAIDMNVIFLLIGMMIIVGILKRTGLFQWLAYKSYELARGNVFILAATLMLAAATASSMLDNVTTMLLIIPVTIEIALTLEIHPTTLLIPEVFASNIGGTATLIGDPPNIMIGSYANLSFVDFLVHLGPVCLICLVVGMGYFILWHGKSYRGAQAGKVQETIERLKRECRITDRRTLVFSTLALGITLFLFAVHGALHMEPSIAAMTGAAFLLLVTRTDISETLERDIEWATIIFFIMLFVVIAGAQESGLIHLIAEWLKQLSQGSLVQAILMVLWGAALASAFIDNIPFTATMLPVVSYLTEVIPGAEGGVLWWALALGACLGGNGTMIGASANLVTAGMSERAGYPISFRQYAKVAFTPMVITIILCSLWFMWVGR